MLFSFETSFSVPQSIIPVCMWSGKHGKVRKKSKKLPRSGKSQGNSFSANLRPSNFEIFWGSMPSDSPKIFRTCSKNFALGQGKVSEMSWESQVILFKIFCIHLVF